MFCTYIKWLCMCLLWYVFCTCIVWYVFYIHSCFHMHTFIAACFAHRFFDILFAHTFTVSLGVLACHMHALMCSCTSCACFDAFLHVPCMFWCVLARHLHGLTCSGTSLAWFDVFLHVTCMLRYVSCVREKDMEIVSIIRECHAWTKLQPWAYTYISNETES